MKPFVQKQNQPASRWLVLVGVVATGLGAWYFDLLPELRPVPSGHLVEDPADDVPMLPDTWDAIVDHTDESESSDTDEFDALLNAIAGDPDSMDREFPELSEPDLAEEPQAVEDVTTAVVNGESDRSIQTAALQTIPPATDANGATVNNGVVPAAVSRTVSVLSSEAADMLRKVDQLILQEKIVDAHFALSELYWKQPEVRPVLQRRIESTAAEIFDNPDRHFGTPYLVEHGDTLQSIGEKYNLPWQYLRQLNRIHPHELRAGEQLKVMQGPFSALIDLSRFELTIHAHGYFVNRYDIGIGARNKTPLGSFQVKEKIENPTWYNPDGGQVDKDDPQNPLGEYWIGLGDHIGIHGTIDPQSIGSARSRGCIHMRDADIAKVFGMLGRNSVVRIRP